MNFSTFLFLLLTALASVVDDLIPLRTEAPPVIDGKLDEPLWQQAPSVTGFKTYFPDFEKDMPDPTVVYYAYDRENLYFAFRCLPDDNGFTETKRGFFAKASYLWRL